MRLYLNYQSIFVLTIMNLIIVCNCCGNHTIIKSNEVGWIQSPGYPDNYSNYAHCIWVLEVPNNYVVQLNFQSSILLDSNGCRDYIEIRDGNYTGIHLGFICNTTIATNIAFKSNYKYMWIRFRSNDRVTNNGFSASFTASFTNMSTDFSLSCPSHMFQCSNRHCIEWAYICNNVSDCGTSDSNDDEGSYWCGKLPITPQMKYGISIGSGLFLMFWICLLSGMHQGKLGCFRSKKKLDVDKCMEVQLMIEQMGRNKTRLSLWEQKSNLSVATKRSDNYLYNPTNSTNNVAKNEMVPYKPKYVKKKPTPKKRPKPPVQSTIVKKPKKPPVWEASVIKLSRPTKASEFRSSTNPLNAQPTTSEPVQNRPTTSNTVSKSKNLKMLMKIKEKPLKLKKI